MDRSAAPVRDAQARWTTPFGPIAIDGASPESFMSSAMVTAPVTPVKRPRTLVTMKWRPMKARSVCSGSMSQVPTAGRVVPSTVRLAGVIGMVVMLIPLPVRSRS